MTDEYLTDEEYYSQFDDYEDHEGYESFPINDKLTLYIKKNIPENSKEICKDYWDITIDEEYKIKFVLTVNEIREKYKLHRDTVIKTAKENAYIFEEALKCYSCKEILINEKRNTRSGFYKINLNKNNNLLCDTCNKIKIEMEEKKQEEKGEQKRKEDIEKHLKAIETAMYETLSPLELNYLITLAKTGKSYEVAKTIGISESKRDKLHKKMEELKLIIFPYSGGYYMDHDFNKALCKLDTYSNVKSIFGSKLASELYKKLKKEHLYVYPEIPLAAFIRKEQIEHLFTETWHTGYFLMCRLDFVVTNPEGIPKFGVEFQGGYHDNKDQQIKDIFKLNLINEIGLEIQYYKSSDLKGY
jgi:hypothetical protein